MKKLILIVLFVFPIILNAQLSVIPFESRCLNSGSIFSVYDNAQEPILFEISGNGINNSILVSISKHTFTALAPGNYIITATDANNVSEVDTVTVPGTYILPSIIATVSKETTCPSGNDGEITIGGTDGRQPYYYELYTGTNNTNPADLVAGSFGNIFSGLPVGNYTAALIDSCNNQVTTNVSMVTSFVDIPLGGPITANIIERISCDSLRIQAPFASTDYEYAFFPDTSYQDGPLLSIEINPLFPETIILIRSKTCPDIMVTRLLRYNNYEDVNITEHPSTCNEYNFSVTAPYLLNPKYSYIDPISNDTVCSSSPILVEGMTNTDYNISVTDDCGFDMTFYRRKPGFVGFTYLSNSPSTCELGKSGVTLGAIDGYNGANPFQINMLTVPPTYTESLNFIRNIVIDPLFNTFSLTETIGFALPEGNYEVEFIDDCLIKDTVAFLVDNGLYMHFIDAKEVPICGNNKNIEFNFETNGLSPSDTIQLKDLASDVIVANNPTITNGVSSEKYVGTFQNISPGNYYVEWSKCDILLTEQVTVTPPVALGVSATGTICGTDLEIHVSGTGGVGSSYEYRILDGPTSGPNSGNSFPTPWGSNSHFTQLTIPSAGDPNYSVQVRDDCNSIVSYEITDYTQAVSNVIVYDIQCDPSLMITFGPQPFLSSANYTWQFPDTTMNSAFVTYWPQDSTGTVMLTTSFPGCPDTTTSTTWDVSCSTLPLKWLDFSAKESPEGIQLRWNTAHEWNVDKFQIYKKTEQSEWNKIGEVEAVGIGENHYDFYDRNTIVGLQYYKVVSIDFDGQENHSVIKGVLLEFNERSTFTLYPNPSRNRVFFKSDLLDDGFSLLFYNVAGSLVSSVSPKENTEIDISMLPNGMYIVRMLDNNKVVLSTDKLIIAR